MAKSITCVYTAMGLQDRLQPMLEDVYGKDTVFHHIVDSGFIRDVVAADGMTDQLKKRLNALLDSAALTDPDLLLVTCSSIGYAAEEYAQAHPEVPLMRIDYPMAKTAAENGKNIVVLATLSTTVTPSCELIERIARQIGRDVSARAVTADGAYALSNRGEKEKAAHMVERAVREYCMDADTIVLAQASMAMFRSSIEEILGKDITILESPATCCAYLKACEEK